jgi:hypothetical protein
MELAAGVMVSVGRDKQAVFRLRIPPSLLGSRQGGKIREMEGEERDVVLRFPAGG